MQINVFLLSRLTGMGKFSPGLVEQYNTPAKSAELAMLALEDTSAITWVGSKLTAFLYSKKRQLLSQTIDPS